MMDIRYFNHLEKEHAEKEAAKALMNYRRLTLQRYIEKYMVERGIELHKCLTEPNFDMDGILITWVTMDQKYIGAALADQTCNDYKLQIKWVEEVIERIETGIKNGTLKK
jgi:hypothetical protein